MTKFYKLCLYFACFVLAGCGVSIPDLQTMELKSTGSFQDCIVFRNFMINEWPNLAMEPTQSRNIFYFLINRCKEEMIDAEQNR